MVDERKTKPEENETRCVLFARWLWTPRREKALEDVFVRVGAGRILQIGKRSEFSPRTGERRLDLGETVLLPGLINAHVHLEFTAFKGKVPFYGDFFDWLVKIGEKSRTFSPNDWSSSVRSGLNEALHYGTTFLCEVSTYFHSCSVLYRSPVRTLFFFEFLDIASGDPRTAWAAFQEKFWEKQRMYPPHSRFQVGIAPHTPFTVSPVFLRFAADFLKRRSMLPVGIHLAESREELRFFQKGTGPIARRLRERGKRWAFPVGVSPVGYLNRIGWLSLVNLAVHANHLEERDYRLLRRNRTAVVHCPGSHAFFRRGRFPYEKFRKHRIPVVLGTDSLASNSSLSLFREMRLFARAHPGVPPQEILRMPTIGAARALGYFGKLGEIEPGREADLIGVPLPARKRFFSTQELCERILAHQKPVAFVMVAGRPVWRVFS